MQDTRDALEQRQIPIYFAAVALAAVAAWALPGTGVLERAINPALALMLYVTFLQVPVAELRRAFGQARFLTALMVANFIMRSEEHTSELQSQSNLVCRLLLEKKKKTDRSH